MGDVMRYLFHNPNAGVLDSVQSAAEGLLNAFRDSPAMAARVELHWQSGSDLIIRGIQECAVAISPT